MPSPGDAPALRGSEEAIRGSIHVALGVPRDSDPSDEFFLDQRVFIASYNPARRVPNWVAWRLDASNLGSVARKNDFRPDLSLPARFYRVTGADYAHSGYDRGHLCPSADRKSSRADNSLTFLFTNMLPQVHELNAGPWERLEVYARQRAQRGEVLYSVAGGVYRPPFLTIGNGVAVPSETFKILVVLHPGEGPSALNGASEVLAVLMPNQRNVAEHDWKEYLTSVDAVEALTGYDFLDAVPEQVQQVIEARVAHF